MRDYNKRFLISKDYFLFASTIILVVVLLCAVFSWTLYNSFENNKKQILATESNHIENAMEEVFDNTSRIAIYIGKQIAEHENEDLDYIYNLFHNTTGPQYKSNELLSWSLFDWVNKDNYQVIGSKKGVYKTPIDMSHREYTKYTAKEPWKLHLSDPAVGIPSGKWIIPAAIGISDGNEYLGAISLGFNLTALTEKMEDISRDQNISFIILDDDYNIVMKSADNDIDLHSTYYKDILRGKNLFKNKQGEITDTLTYNDIEYNHYNKFDEFPYIILAGYNNNYITKEFNSMLFPRLLEFIGIGAFFLIILYLFRRYIIVPITALSNTADQISKGYDIKRFPRTNFYETYNLTNQLIKIKRLLRREKLHKQALQDAKNEVEQALRIVKESKKAKEEFQKKLRARLHQPIVEALLAVSDILSKKHGEYPKPYQHLAHKIYEDLEQLTSMTTTKPNRVKANPREIIEECITIFKEKAYEKKIHLETNIAKNLPEIMLDEVCFRQMLVSTLFHSFALIGDDEHIKITANIEEHTDRPQELVIKIEDTGFGYDENIRNIMLGGDMRINSRDSDGIDLNIDDIRRLAIIHRGSFSLTTTHKKGAVFIIALPCIKPEEEKQSFPENVTLLFGN